MNQLRLDPLTGRWVVVSIDRAERPVLSPPGPPPSRPTPRVRVPSAPGTRDRRPPPSRPTAPRAPGSSGSSPTSTPPSPATTPSWSSNRGPVYTQATAGGIHEVLVLSPEHASLGPSLRRTGRAWSWRPSAIASRSIRTFPGLRYSQAIVNAGREAGASIEHPHGQLLGHVLRPPGTGRGAGRLRPFRRSLPPVHHRRRRGGRRLPRRLRRRPGPRDLSLLGGDPVRDAGHPPQPRPASPPGQPGRPHGRGPAVADGPGPARANAAGTSPTTWSSTRPPTGPPSPTTGTSTSGPSSPPRPASSSAPGSSSTSWPPSRPAKSSAWLFPPSERPPPRSAEEDPGHFAVEDQIDGLGLGHRFGDGDPDDLAALEAHHRPEGPVVDSGHRRRPEPGGQDPVESGRGSRPSGRGRAS